MSSLDTRLTEIGPCTAALPQLPPKTATKTFFPQERALKLRSARSARDVLGTLLEDRGQDTVEYALLTSLISIIALLSLEHIMVLLRMLYGGIRMALMTVSSVLF